jgi:hypothetical protein
MAIQNNKKLLHRKEPQMMSPNITASAAGTFLIKDPLGVRRTALFVGSNTAQRLYDIFEDGWMELPSFALAGTFGAGACGGWALWSDTFTVGSQGVENGLNFVSVSVQLSMDAVGRTLRFLTGNNEFQEVVVTDIKSIPLVGTVLYFTESLPNTIDIGDTFALDTGAYYILNAYTALASGVFKRYDVVSGTVTTLSNTGLPTTWGIDGKIVATPSYYGNYSEGSVTSASGSSLTSSSKTWTVNQWNNSQVKIIDGTGKGQVRNIVSSTSDTLNVAPDWTITPDTTSVFAIQANDNYVYLLGNNSVVLRRYNISEDTWSTITPNVARSGTPNVGMGAVFIGKTKRQSWNNEDNIQSGRYIYSFVGNGTSTLNRYDIALNQWATITYIRQGVTFTTGSSFDGSGGKIYILKESSGRLYYYDCVDNQLLPFTTDFFPQGTAVVGDKLFTVTYNDGAGDDIDFLYYQINTGTTLRRIMIY